MRYSHSLFISGRIESMYWILGDITFFRLARLCQDLGHESSSAKHSAAAGSVFPLPSDIAKSGSWCLSIAALFWLLAGLDQN